MAMFDSQRVCGFSEHGGYAKYPQNGHVIGFTEPPIESRADSWGVNAFS